MLESILKFREIDRSPYLTFIWALMVTTIGVLFSTQLAYRIQVGSTILNLSGLFSVIFTIIPSVYFLTIVIKREEKIEEELIRKHYTQKFWQRHEKDILFFLFYFFGVTFAFALWSFILPVDFFQVQINEIQNVRASVTGEITKGSFNSFLGVSMNNLQVLLFAFIFSLLFGAGAVFIIVWNASVLGVYIGELSKSLMEIPLVSLSFLPHGIPEVVGYLCAGLGGGLLSAAVLRSHSSEILRIILFDSIKIVIIGIAFIFLAAGIEVYL
jgi:uncharacterized membrane protein SpoIIM required for sporulation